MHNFNSIGQSSLNISSTLNSWRKMDSAGKIPQNVNVPLQYLDYNKSCHRNTISLKILGS